jgi:hypothetical protein
VERVTPARRAHVVASAAGRGDAPTVGPCRCVQAHAARRRRSGVEDLEGGHSAMVDAGSAREEDFR